MEIMDDYIVESEMFHVFDYDIEVKDASSMSLGRQRMSFPDLAHRESVDTEDD